jgi:BirA family biotin operon repressor/biotin-[acetyl-CoA-carboxylase] ligase
MLKKKINSFFKKKKYDFIHLEKTTSTMIDVRNYIEKYNKNCIYIADQQSQGRGQRGNIWHSHQGNIYLSISFDNFLDVKEHFLFSVLINISVKESLEKFNAKYINFKWPNDIFYKKKKFAGMISEIINISTNKSYIIIGLGINFISAPKIDGCNATYVQSFCKIQSIDDFLLVFIKILFLNLEELRKKNNDALIENFSKYLMLINEEINIILPNNGIKKGIFRGVNYDGSLQLEVGNKVENIYNGSILL